MRILMTTDTVGGVWTYTRELVTGLLQADEYARIFLFAVGTACGPEQLGWLRAMRERNPGRFESAVHSMPLEWEQRNDEVDPLEPRLLAIAHTFAPDLFHSNQFCYGALPVRCPRLIVAHSDVLSWHAAVHGEPPQPSAWLDRYRTLVRYGVAGAAALVAPTQWMLRAFCDGFAVPALTRVIHNGTALRSDVRQGRRLQAVTAGRLWDRGKNITLLQHLRRPALPVLVAGALQHEGTRLSWSGSPEVQLLGSLSHRDLITLFTRSSIYVSTALYEPFGLSMLEAARSGCALLALDIDPMREIWGGSARYFRNAEELSELLDRLTASPMDLILAQQRALAASRRYTRVRMAEAYSVLYRELIESHPENSLVA